MEAISHDGARMTREVRMKNLFIIIALAVFQSACSTQAPRPHQQSVLLDFTDLASEMTVDHELEAGLPETPGTVGKNQGDSS